MRLIVCLLAMLLLLQACTPILLGVTGTVVATSFFKEKSLGNTIDDATIWAKINSILIKERRFFDIKVRVDEGRVLLTGIVHKPKASIAVIDLVWKTTGVKEVINEIMIHDEGESIVKSAWITTHINAKLLVRYPLKSSNYTIVTVDDIVYLFGIAQNNIELNKIIKLASTVEGVEKVISHVRLKGSKLRGL